MTMSVFNTYSDLRAASPTAGDTGFLLGYNSKGDGGGGDFYWDSASTATHNGGTVIQPGGGGTGRWFRVYDGPLDVKWFGATGNGSTDDHAAIQAAADYAGSLANYGSVYLSRPASAYAITTAIAIPQGVNFIGDGGRISILVPNGCGAFTYNFFTGFGNSTIRDIGIEGVNGTSQIAIYQPGTLTETDFLYGITIDNVLIRNFNIAIKFRTVTDVTIRNCWIQDVNSGIHLIGQCRVVNMHDNKIIYAAGCGSGAQYGILCDYFNYTSGGGVLRPEAVRISAANTIYGFATGVAFNAVAAGWLETADVQATVDGVVWSSATGLVIRSNYIEIDDAASSVAIRGIDQTVPIDTKVLIEGNICICGGTIPAGTIGIKLGTGGGAGNQDNVSIVNNAFYNFTLYDIAAYSSGKNRIRDNDCYSTAVTKSIVVSGIPSNRPVWVDGNTCYSDIQYDSSAYTSGLLQLDTNVINQTTEDFGNLGSWTAPAFSAGDFTASGSMSWTVGSGNVDTFAYNIRGKVMTISLVLTNTTVGGAPAARLWIHIPAGKTAARHMAAPCFIIDGGIASTGFMNIAAGDTQISVNRTDGANWSASSAATYVLGQIVLEIQ
jgi:Pectate lyase superfamily protein